MSENIDNSDLISQDKIDTAGVGPLAGNDMSPDNVSSDPHRYHRKRRRFVKILKWTLIGLLCVLLLVTAVLYWITQSESGARFAIAKVQKFVPALVIHKVHGSLDDGLTLTNLTFETESMLVHADSIDLKTQVFGLFRNRLTINKFLANELIVVTASGEKVEKEPAKLPDDIGLPIQFSLNSLLSTQGSIYTVEEEEWNLLGFKQFEREVLRTNQTRDYEELIKTVLDAKPSFKWARIEIANLNWDITSPESYVLESAVFDTSYGMTRASAEVEGASPFENVITLNHKNLDVLNQLDPKLAPIDASLRLTGSLKEQNILLNAEGPFALSLTAQASELIAAIENPASGSLNANLDLVLPNAERWTESVPPSTLEGTLQAAGPFTDLHIEPNFALSTEPAKAATKLGAVSNTAAKPSAKIDAAGESAQQEGKVPLLPSSSLVKLAGHLYLRKDNLIVDGLVLNASKMAPSKPPKDIATGNDLTVGAPAANPRNMSVELKGVVPFTSSVDPIDMRADWRGVQWPLLRSRSDTLFSLPKGQATVSGKISNLGFAVETSALLSAPPVEGETTATALKAGSISILGKFSDKDLFSSLDVEKATARIPYTVEYLDRVGFTTADNAGQANKQNAKANSFTADARAAIYIPKTKSSVADDQQSLPKDSTALAAPESEFNIKFSNFVAPFNQSFIALGGSLVGQVLLDDNAVDVRNFKLDSGGSIDSKAFTLATQAKGIINTENIAESSIGIDKIMMKASTNTIDGYARLQKQNLDLELSYDLNAPELIITDARGTVSGKVSADGDIGTPTIALSNTASELSWNNFKVRSSKLIVSSEAFPLSYFIPALATTDNKVSGKADTVASNSLDLTTDISLDFSADDLVLGDREFVQARASLDGTLAKHRIRASVDSDQLNALLSINGDASRAGKSGELNYQALFKDLDLDAASFPSVSLSSGGQLSATFDEAKRSFEALQLVETCLRISDASRSKSDEDEQDSSAELGQATPGALCFSGDYTGEAIAAQYELDRLDYQLFRDFFPKGVKIVGALASEGRFSSKLNDSVWGLPTFEANISAGPSTVEMTIDHGNERITEKQSWFSRLIPDRDDGQQKEQAYIRYNLGDMYLSADVNKGNFTVEGALPIDSLDSLEGSDRIDGGIEMELKGATASGTRAAEVDGFVSLNLKQIEPLFALLPMIEPIFETEQAVDLASAASLPENKSRDNRPSLIAGRIDIDGPLNSPYFDGNITINDLDFRIPEAGVDVRRVTGSFTTNRRGELNYKIAGFSQSETIPRGEQKKNRAFKIVPITGGEIAVIGKADYGSKGAQGFAENLRAEMTIKGKKFLAVNNSDAMVYISPDIDIKLREKRIDVKGTLTVPEAHISPRQLPEGAVRASEDQIILSDEGLKSLDGETYAIYSDVELLLSDKVKLEAFGFTGRIEGSLKTKMRPDEELAGQGEFNVVDGEYRAYGQGLVVRKGRVLFNGPLSQPAVDLRAIRRPADNILVGITALGPARQPDVRIFSEPSMGRTEQLSWLVLGRPLENSSQGEGSILSQLALSYALNAGDSLFKTVGSAFGADTVAIETGSSEAGTAQNNTQAAVVVGKYLSPKLYISYGLGLFDAVNTVKVRYTLNKYWKLAATSSGEGSGGDVIYQLSR